MKNFKMKNIILGALIAVMAIACFAVVGVTLNNVPKYEREQEIHIAGLEFEDGWNLISDAEDYYLMTENTSTGKNAGAKYRLTNDITINPYRAKQDAFIGATLDGAGYKVMVDNNAQLEMEASDEPKYVQENTQSSEPEYVEDELVGAAKFNGRTLKALSHTKKDGTTVSVFPWLNSNVDGGSNSTQDKSQAIYPCSLYSQYQDYTVGINGYKFNTSGYYEIAQLGGGSYAVDDGIEVIAIGGMYGAIVEGVVSNLSIQYTGDVTFSGSSNKDDSVCFGLFAGYVYNSSVYNCMVYVNYNTAQNRGVQVIANNTQDNSTFAYFIGQYYQKTTEKKWIPIGTTIKPDPSIVVPGNYINNNFVFYSGSSPDDLFSISNPFSNYKEGDINIEMKYGSVWLEHVVTYTVGTSSLSSTKIFNIFSDLRECYHLAPSTAYTDASQYEGIYKSSADYFSADSSDRNNHWAMIPGIHGGTLFQTHYMSDYAYTVKLDPGAYTLGDDCGYKKIGSTYYKVIGKNQKLGKLPTPSGLDSSKQKYNWVTSGGSIVTSEVVVKRDLTLKLNVTGVNCITYYYGKNIKTGIDGAPVLFNDFSNTGSFDFSYGGTVTFKTLDDHDFTHSKLPPDGYYFVGWCTDSSAERVDYEAGITYDGVTPNKGNKLYLYAVYRPRNYYIYIDPLPTVQYAGDMSIYDGITGLEGEEYKVNDRDGFCMYKSYGSTIQLPTLTREKYDFIGWYTSWDPEKQEYSGKVEGTTFVVPNNDTTLYAKWEKQLIKVNVTLDYNYKESPDGPDRTGEIKNVQYGEDYGNSLTTATTKPGYNFLGWTSDYLDVSSFIWWYNGSIENGAGGALSTNKPFIDDEGWLYLDGEYTGYWESGIWYAVGYPIYLTAGTYRLSATTYCPKYIESGDDRGYGSALCIAPANSGSSVLEHDKTIDIANVAPTTTSQAHRESIFTVETGMQCLLYGSYWHGGRPSYYKDIRITRLNDDGTEAKYQGTYNRPNELRIIDAGSAVIAPYDHTLYANWSEELDAIEFVVDAENPENPKMVVSALQYNGENGIEFNGEDYYINLGRKYMFEDSLYVSVDAYMDDWAQLGVGTLISCTQEGGWRLAADDNNTGMIEFQLRTTNNTEYTYVQSKTAAGTLSPGWHTFKAIYDGSKMALYIDNILQQELGVTGNISYNGTNSIFVGGEATSIPSEPSLGDWGFKGKMRNLYIANTPFSQSYYHDGKIIFDGEDDYVDLGTQYQFTDSLYISFMAYMEDWTTYADNKMRFISCTDGGGWNFESLEDDNGLLYFVIHDGTKYVRIPSIKPLSDFLNETWYKFKVVWNGSKVYYYINEELQNVGGTPLSQITYSSQVGIHLGCEKDAGRPLTKFFKGALSNIYISNGKPGHTEMFNVTGQSYQRFPALVNTSEGYKFIGWKLSGDRALDGAMLGNDIFFYNGLGFKKYGNDDYDGQLLLGFTSSMEMDNGTVYSSGFARLIAIYDDTTIPTPDDWPNPGGGGGGGEPGGGDNEIQDPQPDLNITMFTIELQYEDANINYNPSSEKASFDGIYIIYFDGHEGFALPNSSQVTRYGYTFDKWQVISLQVINPQVNSSNYSDWTSGANPTAVPNGVNINAKLEAVWTENVYEVKIHSNVPDNDAVAEKTIYKHTENIELSLNELFSDLKYNADYNDDGILDYRFVGWTIGDRNSGLGYAEINSRYGKTGNSKNNDTSGDKANTFDQLFINWGKVSVGDTELPIIFKDITEVSKLIHGYADEADANDEEACIIQIYAVWTPVYKVTIQANMDGDNHNCGDGECVCGIYDSGKKTTAISGDGSAYIVPQDEQYDFGESTVTQTIKTQHYFQGYEIPGFDFKHVFNEPGNNEFGLHYYGHEIYGWKITVDSSTDKYVLKYRTDENGNVLVKNGKPVLEDGTQLSHWLKIANSTTMLQHPDYNDVYYVNIEGEKVYCVDLIPDKIDLKCLQGNIILIPQWRPVVFDVEFKTAAGQGYKNNYKDKVQESQITFGSTYLTIQSAVPTTGEGENKKLNGSIGTLYATDIYGYTVIYAHPYDGDVDEETYITTTGTWDYMLKYKTYPEGKDSHYGNKFYIEIEGYYAPDLYRVKIDLDLPYTNNNNFNVVYNGFVEGATLGDSKYTMSPYVKYDSETYSVDKYVLVYVENKPKYMYEKTGYQNYQHKLIKVTEVGKDAYYIYLLQDQVIGYDDNKECAYIENAYYNGKAAESNKKATTYLPTFEIDYYEMQYYYAIGSTTINLYKTAKLDDYQTDLAKQKLSKKYEFDNKEETFPYVSDWKESYNINNTNPIIYIYWYRNILNLDIYNMINPNDSDDAKDQTTVGYVLVTENEQVTLEQGLIDHKQYHLVIYAYNNGQLGYVVYEFNDISVLENSDFYKYIQLLGKNNTHLTLEDLKELSTIDNVNILESNKINNKGKYIPIYFGNSVTIEAVDQGKDQSLDEFIGYRFRNFEYVENCDNITSIDKFKVDEGNPNQVIIDLRNYEQGKDFTDDGIDNPNTTNYFEDQDVLTIKAHFEPIKYKFNYQTVNESYEYYPQAGNIQLNYEGTSVNGMRAETVSSKFAYYVNVNAIGSNTSIRNYMNIELGYEHLNWHIYKNVYSQNTTNLLIKTGDTQEFIFKVDAEFLRTYYGGNYTTDLVQDIYGYSECKLMEFKIQVHVIDVSTNTNAREPYELSTSDELFTISSYPLTLNDKTPSNNNYTITMLEGAEGYTFVTYVYGGKAYILQELYIKTAGSSMTIKDFMTMYPARSLGQYDINITSGLLGQTISNTQYVELEEDDRVLHFYIDVAPVITMAFEVVESEDKNLSDRTLMIGSETIAKGFEGEDFKVEVTSDGEESTYVGYWGQNILLTFIAGNHYRSIDFEIEYVDESQKEKIDQLSIIPGNNKIYTLKGNSTAKIKIVPNTYDLTAYISYNGNRYEISEYELITNAVGDNIFKSVEITAHEDNISQAGMYYTGDKFEITYELNPEVLKDITIEVLENGDTVDMYDDDRNGVADGSIEFSNVGIELEIRVQDKVQAVILKSNYQDKHAADIRAKVNGGDWTLVQDDTGRKNVIFSLVRGDVLTVYVKEQVGFSFDKTYSYGFVGGTVETEEFDGGWLFTLFADGGFTAEDNGTYTLNFTQIPFEVEFKHYLTTEARELEGSEIPSECIAAKDMSDNERYIQLGSKVKLNKSVDKTGYRFNGYTYVAPQGQELAIELEDEFIVNKTMLQHLATVGTNKKGNVPIVIYLNYVKQHTFNISAKGATVQILDESDKEINPSKYYDFGTKFKVKAKAIDSEHYQIKASINGTEVSQENQDDVAISGKTNLGNLSNFTTVEYTLNNDYTILVEVVAEKYSIRLFQELNNGADIEKDDKELATQSTWFKLSDNVYYQALGTFGYNTEVDIQIFVANPQVDESTYYVLNKVLVDGCEVSVKAGNKSTVYGKQGVTYTIEHTMLGEPPEGSAITSEITITFNAMYYVTVIQ